MEHSHTTSYLKKRKFLLALPVLALPFITLAFWAMGGGSTAKKSQAEPNVLNTELPGVNIPERSLDKMSLYNNIKNANDQFPEVSINDSLNTFNNSYPLSSKYDNSEGFGKQDPNELKIRERLEELERSLNQPAKYSPYEYRQERVASEELANLESIVNGMQENTTNEDPEIQQLNKMLENIMEIQNPEFAKQRLRQLSVQQKSRVFAVSKQQKNTQDTALNNDVKSTIPAVVHHTQTLVNGETIKLRLTEPILVNGQIIPENTFVSGVCNINGERLKIEITGLRKDNAIYPVSLIAYDLDAIEGIRIPGAITREVAKDGAADAIQNMQLMSLDPSLAAQSATIGVETAKGLFRKKAKLIRVTVKAGYPILLVDLKGQ